jgi:hypothetical protein
MGLSAEGKVTKTVYEATARLVDECLTLEPECFDPLFSALQEKQALCSLSLSDQRFLPVQTVNFASWAVIAQYSSRLVDKLQGTLKYLTSVVGVVLIQKEQRYPDESRERRDMR